MRLLQLVSLLLLLQPVAGQTQARMTLDQVLGRPTVEQVMARAIDHFHRGRSALEQNKLVIAREEFDLALDEVLTSGLDVRADKRLSAFYLELVERIYREEVPVRQSATNVGVAIARSSPTPPVGFKDQTFVYDKTDLLARPRGDSPCQSIPKTFNIRGLALRDTVLRARQLFPSLQFMGREDAVGFLKAKFIVHPKKPSPKGLERVGALNIEFINGKVSSILALYESSDAWANVSQFADAIATQFGMPSAERWIEDKDSSLMLVCDPGDVVIVQLTATANKYPTIVVFDAVATNALKERRARLESDLKAQERRRFKP